MTKSPPTGARLLEVIALGVVATFAAFLAMAVGALLVDRLFHLEPVELPLLQNIMLWWTPASLAGIVVGRWWWRESSRQLRVLAGICVSCGYNLTRRNRVSGQRG